MTITLIQQNLLWEDKTGNMERLEASISTIPAGTDIVILPEMFTTGFTMNPEKLAETPRSVTFRWMKKMSSEGGFALCGSYIVKEGNNYYNRWVFVSPAKESWSYDKRHLFGPGGEDKLFTRGSERVIFTFREVRICPAICYDLRFPVWNRNRNDYDLLINSSNWPENRRDVWITLLKARAIENQSFVAGVNRVGVDGAGISYCGDSVIVNPRGEIISEGVLNEECLVTGTLSMSQLTDIRNEFPVAKDADNFTIKI